MKKYNNQEFLEAINQKMGGHKVPQCPYCGGQKFTTPEQFASILIGDDLAGINLGPTVPAGMIICEKCGHIEFFALGLMDLLPKESSKNGS